jgi:hypothetical protein
VIKNLDYLKIWSYYIIIINSHFIKYNIQFLINNFIIDVIIEIFDHRLYLIIILKNPCLRNID